MTATQVARPGERASPLVMLDQIPMVRDRAAQIAQAHVRGHALPSCTRSSGGGVEILFLCIRQGDGMLEPGAQRFETREFGLVLQDHPPTVRREGIGWRSARGIASVTTRAAGEEGTARRSGHRGRRWMRNPSRWRLVCVDVRATSCARRAGSRQTVRACLCTGRSRRQASAARWRAP
jgi:hypothetical protein